jgi:hypothetical protein
MIQEEQRNPEDVELERFFPNCHNLNSSVFPNY